MNPTFRERVHALRDAPQAITQTGDRITKTLAALCLLVIVTFALVLTLTLKTGV